MKEYFSHDFYARSDEKIEKLIAKHGNEGYGLYWGLVEKLYIAGGKIESDYECIAFALRTQCDKISSIINDYKLFVDDGEFISSESVNKRLNLRNTKAEKARNSAEKRWEYANAKRTQSERNANKRKINIKEKINKKESFSKTKLQEYIEKELPNICKIKNQLTYEESEKLTTQFNKQALHKILNRLENYNKASKYNSVYRTILAWLDKEGIKPSQQSESLDYPAIKSKFFSKFPIGSKIYYENSVYTVGTDMIQGEKNFTIFDAYKFIDEIRTSA